MKKIFNSKLPQQKFIIYMLILIINLLIDFSNANNLNCVKTPTRPFYLIGHMCNSIEEVRKFVASGANSVEVDIQFTDDGLLDMVYHGIPCDCFRFCTSREDLDTMFEYLKDISTPGNAEYQPHFALVLFDLKIKRLTEKAKITAGIMMADKLINILFESEQGSSRLKVITGLELSSDYPFVYALVDRFNQRNFPDLLDRIGFDVSGNEEIREIEYLWKYMFENKLNVWQGDGITNCLSYLRPAQRVKDLIKLRESNLTDSYTSKIYLWTIDSKKTIRESLRLGVDGIITNEVENVIEALDEYEFKSNYHLANSNDDPFCIVRDFELQVIRQNYYQLNKPKLMDNNFMVTNYVMHGNEQTSALTTSQPIKPTLKQILNSNNNFENDNNLIRIGNDFKRNSFSEINLRQLLTQFIAFLNKRNTYDNFMRFNLLGRNLRQTDFNPLNKDFSSRTGDFSLSK